MKIWKLACLFGLCYGINQSSFEVLLLENILISGHYLKKRKTAFSLKTTAYEDAILI